MLRNLLRGLLLLLLICQQVYAQDTLKKAEYFFDTDPGFGSGIALPIGNPGDSVGVTASVNIPPGLSYGMHALYVRAYADSGGYRGRWSQVVAQRFYIGGTGQLTASEYFFDTDPGPGNGTALPVTVPNDTVAGTYTIPTTGLNAGTHSLYTRTRSADGVWSLVSKAGSFYITNTLVSAEYFIDTDPGPGNGTAFSIGTGDSIATLANVQLPANIPAGDHKLYVRAKDGNRKWSIAAGSSFYVLPSIIATEYFWDTDPGVGQGTALTVSAADSVAANYTIATPCLSPGVHYLYLRTRGNNSTWSLVRADSITFANPSLALQTLWPGPGPDGTPVKLTATGGAAPYLYRMNGNAFAADSILLAGNDSTVIFSVRDACNYTADTTVTMPAAPMDIAGGTTGSGTINFIGWNHWVYVRDAGGNIIGAVNDRGQNLGNVTIGYGIHTGPVRQFPNAVSYLDRNWVISAQHALSGSRDLRLYALNNELDTLKAADNQVHAIGDLYITQYDGPNEDLDFGNNAYAGNCRLLPPASSAVFNGGTTSGFYVGVSLNDFSEFYLSQNYSTPLPQQQVTLRGRYEQGRVRLDWNRTSALRLRSFTVQRLQDKDWASLGTVPASLQQSADYNFYDPAPLPGTDRYRLAMLDEGGTQTYTSVVAVTVAGQASISIYPNPAAATLTIDGALPGTRVYIKDMTGRTIRTITMEQRRQDLDVGQLPAGSYLLSIQLPDHSPEIAERLVISPH